LLSRRSPGPRHPLAQRRGACLCPGRPRARLPSGHLRPGGPRALQPGGGGMGTGGEVEGAV